ncbi:hypothetical protein CXF85_13790 [Colwellia sp. 75C3]|uniref:hypothetical protein n=1 Tax=Colwellia sp. 75C3 TaxID=888425 RepID=UPI000C33B3F7|nr:hypothetical protein [Colwellia sp. 75C3]PKG82549.1 hypothetical protein CXF85_13790 [Colwellia sp. 75C3]
MIKDDFAYRKEVYEQFAHAANAENIRWCVLHGIEGYPNSIGRDLDITCDTKAEGERLINIYRGIVDNHPRTKKMVIPSPIWGDRVLGISNSLDVAELHLIRPVRSAFISFKSDFNDINLVENTFPVSEFLSFSKSAVMPAMVNQKWRHKITGMPEKKHIPAWLIPAYQHMYNNDVLSKRIKLGVLVRFAALHPLKTLNNSYYWVLRKTQLDKYPTTPLVFLDCSDSGEVFRKNISCKMGKIFLKVICGDSLTNKQIRIHQGRQQLVYITQKRKSVDVELNEKNRADWVEMLLSSFSFVNKKWNTEHEQ